MYLDEECQYCNEVVRIDADTPCNCPNCGEYIAVCSSCDPDAEYLICAYRDAGVRCKHKGYIED